eukprot:366324-Chlamydomonas_euryale.AAC.3
MSPALWPEVGRMWGECGENVWPEVWVGQVKDRVAGKGRGESVAPGVENVWVGQVKDRVAGKGRGESVAPGKGRGESVAPGVENVWVGHGMATSCWLLQPSPQAAHLCSTPMLHTYAPHSILDAGPHSTEHSRLSPLVWDLHTATTIRTSEGYPKPCTQTPTHRNSGVARDAFGAVAGFKRNRTAVSIKVQWTLSHPAVPQRGTAPKIGHEVGKLRALGKGSRPLLKVALRVRKAASEPHSAFAVEYRRADFGVDDPCTRRRFRGG